MEIGTTPVDSLIQRISAINTITEFSRCIYLDFSIDQADRNALDKDDKAARFPLLQTKFLSALLFGIRPDEISD